ncbi:MAG: protease modulator HflC [Chloroflexi bacterium]|nr:protease modulator HflC [Chloroflexota bacterium]MCH8868357.1 protease modulator HflC [Chloroflexota bacterium]MCI0770499.1 protease modulator HflC [Chloroflexota bacterium]MCI0791097.1 protease modulator HflC [Chloroflexota bacterium]MCI0842061.1 protease modulator HflC [Chloroflexota bacterium]
MKILAGLIVLFAVLALIIGPQLFYVVDEGQVAILTRFGEVKATIINPGLNVKTPFVETVTYYQKRLLIFDAPAESMLTKDKKRLIIDVYARGKIIDPKLFRETVFTEARASSRAVDIISSELRVEIAKDDQIEIIAVNREEIMNRVRDAVSPKVRQFGIEVIDLRIKRADFPDTIADSVYSRMQAERKRIADRERAQGAERDAEVRADVDRQTAIIRAEAERDAQITRGEGEAESIRIFAEALQQDPEFYAFQRSLQAYRVFLTGNNTTLVLPADSELFQFLQSPRSRFDGTGGGN